MQLKPGDKVRHVDARVTRWNDATVISTRESDPWDCVPGVVRVRRFPDDPGATVPINLLEKL